MIKTIEYDPEKKWYKSSGYYCDNCGENIYPTVKCAYTEFPDFIKNHLCHACLSHFLTHSTLGWTKDNRTYILAITLRLSHLFITLRIFSMFRMLIKSEIDKTKKEIKYLQSLLNYELDKIQEMSINIHPHVHES